MRYIVGSSTGVLKEVDTSCRSLTTLTELEWQDLDKRVTCMSWVDAQGDQKSTTLVIGHVSGLVEVNNYETMERMHRFEMKGRCVAVFSLLPRMDEFRETAYKASKIIPNELYPKVYTLGNDTEGTEYFCCIDQTGLCVVIDYLKMLLELRESPDAHSSTTVVHHPENKETAPETLCIPGIVAAHKFKGPITAASSHYLFSNLVAMGGPNIPPFLFDLYSARVIWQGKMPHGSYLGLQTSLDVRAICFLETLGPEHIAVSTSDSFIYLYNTFVQRKPVYDFNVCDRRSQGLSTKQINLHEIRDYSTERKKEIKKSVNEFYSSDSRNIVKLGVVPVESEDNRYSLLSHCDLIASDNVGLIYHIRLYTGSSLEQIVRNKIRSFRGDYDAVITQEQINDYLLQARKRVGSASANDRPIHTAPSHCSQYIAETIGQFDIHNGAVADFYCSGPYLITVGLDRYTHVYNIKTRKMMYKMYCNQKLTCLLVYPEVKFKTYEPEMFVSPPQEAKNTRDHDSSEDSAEYAEEDEMDVEIDEDDSDDDADDAQEEQSDSGSEEELSAEMIQLDKDNGTGAYPYYDQLGEDDYDYGEDAMD